ncbi:hypothetical protein [Sorangium sp. So ce131]|uniref:hypothetical protein n=1 Tax=Sorangium sp. So ce131 TaxID=3133282 RepID=UPI003F5F8376
MEPRRLLEESDSEFERALLNAGTSYSASPETRAKTLAALGLAGAASISASAAAAGASAVAAAPAASASTSLAAKVGWTKLLAALSVVGAVAGVPAGYYAWRAYTAPPPAALDRFSDVLAGPVARASLPPPPEARAEEQPAEAAAPVDDGSGGAAPKAASRPAGSAAALKAELAALDAARKALAGGDAQGALSRLDAYARAHPRGRLALEAEVLRIDALARSGRLDAARQRATTFLRRHPNSVLATRVRRYVND